MLAVKTGIAEGFSAATKDPLVTIFLFLFLAGAVIFITSLFVESQKPKRMWSFVAFILSAVFAVVIQVENPAGFMGSIGGIGKSFYSTVLENNDSSVGSGTGHSQVNTGTRQK